VGEIDCIVTYLDSRCSFVMWRSKLYDVAVTYTHHYGFRCFFIPSLYLILSSADSNVTLSVTPFPSSPKSILKHNDKSDYYGHMWPRQDCSEFGNCVITLIYRKYASGTFLSVAVTYVHNNPICHCVSIYF
jgi:hypothetical protein